MISGHFLTQSNMANHHDPILLFIFLGSASRITDIRILLTGYQYSGKSSTGNTILAREAFPLKRITKSAKSQGDVQGRHITIVDTPGRWRVHEVRFTSELYKQDIVLSAGQCPPGPHVLLVLVRLDTSFTERNRRAMEGHLELFDDAVWRYTMVLFTCGDFLKETTIEQFIESEGEALQWLVQKCHNRYHVFNNRKEDHTQVSELLEKVEEVVISNGGGHFEMDPVVLQEVQKKRKVAEDKAIKRRHKAQEEQKAGRKLATCSESEKADKRLLTDKFLSLHLKSGKYNGAHLSRNRFIPVSLYTDECIYTMLPSVCKCMQKKTLIGY